jgi:hypothetical protein
VCSFIISIQYSEVLLACARGFSPFVVEGFFTLKSCVSLCLICSCHHIDNGWKLQNKEKMNVTSKTKGKTDGSASVASDNSYDNGDVLIGFAGCAFDDSLWILDYVCSYHICINNLYGPEVNKRIVFSSSVSPTGRFRSFNHIVK